ncbi:hypothetical protein EVAR_69761_1 [Eumeta japonica]|uniref:Uncharacterized protein n=1 Tax=Eumeta variegata TaxID=151549 RepID=A0A4C2ABK8_EUMVA|nr:hypothetical protein EVAR_69761_1 [Eumeta japonica]
MISTTHQTPTPPKGYFGVGWLFEIFKIPSYVRDANEDPKFIEEFVKKLQHYRKPPYSDGNEVPIHEAFKIFGFRMVDGHSTGLKDTYNYAQHHGWYETWKEIFESMDVDGERNAYKILGKCHCFRNRKSQLPIATFKNIILIKSMRHKKQLQINDLLKFNKLIVCCRKLSHQDVAKH